MNEFISEQILEPVAPAVRKFNFSRVIISISLCLSCFNITIEFWDQILTLEGISKDFKDSSNHLDEKDIPFVAQ